MKYCGTIGRPPPASAGSGALHAPNVHARICHACDLARLARPMAPNGEHEPKSDQRSVSEGLSRGKFKNLEEFLSVSCAFWGRRVENGDRLGLLLIVMESSHRTVEKGRRGGEERIGTKRAEASLLGCLKGVPEVSGDIAEGGRPI
ncbi:hypothetical protein WN48_11252 [Eufriesea mexicana]|uniref:Uncharacterized protein n=1 Tax=Eufriesea mexicana TaxID=516756 RepID=A0A310SEZ7_9HYME|nr:hypothetical protein WN48_11252 [Eufriesea mexicana]